MTGPIVGPDAGPGHSETVALDVPHRGGVIPGGPVRVRLSVIECVLTSVGQQPGRLVCRRTDLAHLNAAHACGEDAARPVSPQRPGPAAVAPTIERYPVLVDGEWHEHDLTGPVLGVTARTPFLLEFFALRHADRSPVRRRFRVAETAEGLPPERPLLFHGTGMLRRAELHLLEEPPDITFLQMWQGTVIA